MPAQRHSISSFFLRLLRELIMDLAFGATEASVAPPVGAVSDRSNGFCCGVLCCFEVAVQTHKIAICALQFFDRQSRLQRLPQALLMPLETPQTSQLCPGEAGASCLAMARESRSCKAFCLTHLLASCIVELLLLLPLSLECPGTALELSGREVKRMVESIWMCLTKRATVVGKASTIPTRFRI
jgi:hypothetical protein